MTSNNLHDNQGEPTSKFAKVGDSIIDHVVNVSGDRTPYATPVERKNAPHGVDPSFGTKKNRGRSLAPDGTAKESYGSSTGISASLVFPSDPKTTRNVKLTKRTEGGQGSFYRARKAAGNSDNV